jgi:glycosyltransferase involved in cell wall biosynthesis
MLIRGNYKELVPETSRNKRLNALTLVDAIGTAGGGESLARQVAMNLDRERYRPIFCVSRWTPYPEDLDTLAELRATDVEFIGLERDSRFDLRAWRRLVGLLRAREVDIVHSHKIGSNLWASVLTPLAQTPVFVAHEHTWSFEGKPYRRFVDRELIARRADAFVAVSEEDRRRMHEIEGIPLEKLRYIPNGIPDPLPSEPDADVRAEFGIPAGAPVIGAVATLRPQKALDVLLRGAALLLADFLDLQVLIVGGGGDGPGAPDPVREELEALAAQLGIADHIHLLGLRTDIPEILAALDVGVLSSDFEGQPLSVLEYMEAALPVVSTAVGGIPDQVEDGVTGLLVPPQDPAAWAAAVASLLRDPQRRREFGEAGRRRRREEFSIAGCTRRVESLYEELLAEGG